MDDRGTSKGKRHAPADARDTPPAVTQNQTERTDHKAAGLPATEALLSSIFRAAPIGIGLVVNRVILHANQRLCEMVGYTPEELVGQNARLLYQNQADYDHVGQEKYRQIREHGTGTVETHWRRKDGTVIDVLLSSTPLNLSDLSEGVTFSALDITARKKAEEELQSLFDLSLDMVCIGDINTATFVSVNPAFERTLGYPQESFEGQSFFDLIHPDDLASTQAILKEKLRKGEVVINFENRYRCKDGTYRWLSWMSHPKPEHGMAYAVARDVTERKRADEALRESQAILDETGTIARIGGWRHDLATGKATWTRALYDIIEIEPTAPIPGVEEHLSYYPPEDRHRLEEAYNRAIEIGEPFNLELQVHTAKGHPLWCRVLGRPVMRDGVCVEMRGTFQDISEYVKARQEIERLARFPSENPWPVMRIDRAGTILYANPASVPLLAELGTGMGQPAPSTWCDCVERVHASQSTELMEVNAQNRTLAFHVVPIPSASHVNVYAADVTRHKMAEEQLRRERDRSQMYLDVAGVMFIALDQSGRVCLVNKKGCEILGYHEHELVGMDWFANFVPESRRPYVWDIFDKLMRGETTLAEYAETPVIVRNRSERIIAWHNTVLTDPDGTIIGTLSSGEDITERKRVEAERERLTRILEATSDFVSIGNVEQRITYINRAGKEMLGWPEDEDPSARQIRDVHPEWAYRLIEGEGLPQAIEHGIWSGETAILRSDGTEIPVSQVIMSHKSTDETPDYFSTIMRDLTERKRVEEALRMFQFCVDLAPDAVFWLERDGRFCYVNDRACESLGYSREELTHLHVWDIDPRFPKERMEEEWRQYQKGQIGTQHLETAHRRKDGTEFPIDVSSRHFWFGDTEFHVAFVRDITERKRAEEELRERRENEKQRIESELAKVRDELIRKTRLAALGQVSGSIAHDLRNPLGAVRNASYLLKRRLPKDQPALLDHLAIIEQEVIKADRIITSLLNITRARSPEKQPVDIGALVRAVWNRALHPQGVQLQIELPEEPFVVQADQDQLSQVLSNLLNNAVDAVDGEGQCIVEAQREPQFDVLIVRDTGPGWPQEAREKLFEPLVTTKVSGTGLGLTICRQIVESHGGQIEAVDGDPQGAAIHIRLPRS